MAYTNISGKKLQSKLASTLNESATSHSPALLNSNQSFAKRQLEKMGWTEGTGLGKKRDGMKSHVKIKKREDNMGLGQEKVQTKEMENVWWKDSVGGTLARLQANKKKKNDDKKSISEKKNKNKNKKDKKSKKKSKQESSSSEDSAAIKTYTDEELFEATGGARFGTKGGRRAEGKHKRTESSAELTVLEQKAKASMEWNGRGDAQVVIDKKKQKKKRKHADDDTSEDDNSNVVSPNISEEEDVERTTSSDDDKQSKKKRRKLEKKKEQLHQVSLSDDDDVATAAKKKSKKESKKKKKKSKKSDR